MIISLARVYIAYRCSPSGSEINSWDMNRLKYGLTDRDGTTVHVYHYSSERGVKFGCRVRLTTAAIVSDDIGSVAMSSGLFCN